MTPKFGAYDLEKLVTISKSEKAIKLNDSISLNALWSELQDCFWV